MMRAFNNLRVRRFRPLMSRFVSEQAAVEQSIAPNSKIANWLFGVSSLVAGMVLVGGITRLTKSGLSMTDWKVQGRLPPRTLEAWEKEFARYKTFPEWQQRQSMTLDEFKFIFYWEYGHRMMGRVIGAAFVGPLCYFGLTGAIPRVMYPRMGILFCLGGGQVSKCSKQCWICHS